MNNDSKRDIGTPRGTHRRRMTCLYEKQLSGADLEGADFRGVNIEFSDFRGANLEGALFFGATVTNSNFREANLTGADFRGAILSGCNFRNAITNGMMVDRLIDLSDCKVGYKKVWAPYALKRVVIELRFPEGAQLVSTAIGRKCRASEAVVVCCVTPGREYMTEFRSFHDRDFFYRVGETVRPTERFDNSPLVECTSGIHFFATREEAEEYDY